MRSMVESTRCDRLALVLVAALVTFAAACSSDGDGDDGGDATPVDTSTGEDTPVTDDAAPTDTTPTDTATEDVERPDTAGIDAEALYVQFCGFCHGDAGEGYVSDNANALAHPEFLRIADDDFIRTAIIEGRPGTPMSPWGAERGGPLDAAEVEAITQYIRAWETEAPIDLDDVDVEGSALRGQGPYNV